MRPKARFHGERQPPIAASESRTRDAADAFVSKHTDFPEDDFAGLIEEIMAAAWLARQMVMMAVDDSSVQDAREELALLMQWVEKKDINRLRENWPKVSPDVWNALRCHVVLDPFERGEFTDLAGLRGAIVAALGKYAAVEYSVNGSKVLVRARRHHEVQHAAAIELARRIEAALLPHAAALRISLGAYADNGSQSAIVALLHDVGESIGLVLAMTGWRDILSEARRGG